MPEDLENYLKEMGTTFPSSGYGEIHIIIRDNKVIRIDTTSQILVK